MRLMQNCLARSQAVLVYDNQRSPQLTFNRSIKKNPLFIEIVYFQVVTDIIGQYWLIKIPFGNQKISQSFHNQIPQFFKTINDIINNCLV